MTNVSIWLISIALWLLTDDEERYDILDAVYEVLHERPNMGMLKK